MAQDGGKVVSLTHRPFYPQEILLVLISVRGSVDPRAIVRAEGLCQWKIPMTPSGTEPATFRFAAQHLSHCATAVPLQVIYLPENSACIEQMLKQFPSCLMLRDLLLRISATKLPLCMRKEFCTLEHTVPYRAEMQWRKLSRTLHDLCFRAGQWNANSATELHNKLHPVAHNLACFPIQGIQHGKCVVGLLHTQCRRKNAALENRLNGAIQTTMSQCQPRSNSEDGFRIQYVKMSLKVWAFLTDEANVLVLWFSFPRIQLPPIWTSIQACCSLLYNGYRVILRGKTTGAWR